MKISSQRLLLRGCLERTHSWCMYVPLFHVDAVGVCFVYTHIFTGLLMIFKGQSLVYLISVCAVGKDLSVFCSLGVTSIVMHIVKIFAVYDMMCEKFSWGSEQRRFEFGTLSVDAMSVSGIHRG